MCEECAYGDYGWCCIEGGEIPEDAECYDEDEEKA